MPIDSSLLGWVDRPEYVAESTDVLNYSQGSVYAADQPELKGFWKGETVSLSNIYTEHFGRPRTAQFQRRGTCVSQGTMIALAASLWAMIAEGRLRSEWTEICFEPIYGGSRVNIGQGRLGRGDGSVGAWAAEYVHRYGIHPRGRYGNYDLTDNNESLAVQFGEPGQGVPGEILNDPRRRLGVIAHRCMDVQEIADCIAARYGLAFCSNTIWGRKDSNGISSPESNGGHCEGVLGVFKIKNRLHFQRQQSWGDHNPPGPDVIQTDDGVINLPPGGYGVTGDSMAKALSQGECWAFQITQGWLAV